MLSRYSVKKPYTVVVAIVLILVLGIVSFLDMTTDLLPNMNLPYAVVMTTYIGASPEEVESDVTERIESSMATVSNIENISSISSENYSVVILEFSDNANMDSITLEIRENLDQLKSNWTDSVSNPIIMKLNPDMLPVMVAAVDISNMNGNEITKYVDKTLSPELERIEGVASVSTTGDITDSIQVILRQEKIDEINQKISDTLDTKFASAQSQIDSAKAELEEKQSQLDEGQSQLDSGKDSAIDQIANGQLQLDNAKEQLTSGESSLATQEALITEKESQISVLEAAVAALRKSVAEQESKILQSENKISANSTVLTTYQSIIADADTQIKEKQDKLDDLNKQLNELNSQLDELKTAKAEVNYDNSEQVSYYTSNISKVTKAPTNEDTESTFETEVTESIFENEVTESEEITTETETETDIVVTIPDNSEEISDLESQISDIESQITDLENEISDLETTKANVKTELIEKGYASDNDIRSASTIIESELILLSASKQALEDTREQVANGRQKIEEYEAQIADGKKAIENGKSAIADAKDQIADGKVSLNEAISELNKNQMKAILEFSATDTDLNTALSQMQIASSQLDSSEEEFEATKTKAYDSASLDNILTVDIVKGILKAQNFSMPAGYVTEEGVDYLIRVGNKLTDETDLSNLILFDPSSMDMEDIEPVKLSDIADIVSVDNFDDVYAKINNNDALILSMEKQTGYSTGDVSNKLKDKFKEIMKNDSDVHITTLMDQGIYISLVVNSVLQNMVFGGLLAILILFFFLKDIKPTIIIAFSIPISIVSAIVLMYFSGVTLNIISLSGLALGVGMLVDNSIVVIENIFRLRNEGISTKKAAVDGAIQVSGAIFASTLTTVSVFAPIVFTTGITKQLFVDMGLTIAYSLLASLIVALTLVPMMAAGIFTSTKEVSYKFLDKLQNFYGNLLNRALNHKVFVLIFSLVLLVCSALLSMSKGTAFMPDMESTQVTVTMSMEDNTLFDDLCNMSDEVVSRLEDIDDIETIGAMSGGSSILNMGGSSANNSITMYLILKENRKLNNKQLSSAIEDKTSDLDCDISVDTSSMDMSAMGGSGISIEIKGRELDTLQNIATDIADLVSEVEGTTDVSDGIGKTTPELRIIVDRDKASEYNLTVAQIFQQVAAKIADLSTATTISNDTDDFDVAVLDGETSDLTRDDIESMTITVTSQSGETSEVAIGDIVEFSDGESMSSIQRNSQSRYVSVTAGIDDDHNIGLVSNDVQQKLDKYSLPDGYTIEMVGEDETINEAMIQLLKMLGLAVLFMYLIMVAQFQSLLSPFIIMFTIPLAFTGGFLGLFISNNEISVIAMIGFVMLSGIIVNNGIVLVDYINQLRSIGTHKREAIITAGKTRLRPIIMTALTTILGLSTMAFGMGMGADMVQPMAIVTIGGLIYGTLLTLFVVPCIYDILNRKEMKLLKEYDTESNRMITINDFSNSI